jgi:hypothetical protein
MRTVEQVIAQDVPEALRKFVREGCSVSPEAFCPLAPAAISEPEQQLLVHSHDMTSTLSTFYNALLRVEVLQSRELDDLYLREVFLRTPADEIVEYGVIAIALDQFKRSQQEAIRAGQVPLGGLLHRFKIPFVSAPIGFFSVPARNLGNTPFAGADNAACFGRFNRLTKLSGEPLAWIMEILPPARAGR